MLVSPNEVPDHPARACRLCVGGDEFWTAVEQDIRMARKHVYVQTLSFEGDCAGLKLSNALLASPAPVKRVLADSITNYVINDRLIHLPAARRDRALQREVATTREMYDRLRNGGVELRFTWPIGLRLHRMVVRNHKKLIAIDDCVSYIGGMNFSEHNFAWHDVMLRIESPAIAHFLQEDFRHTWEGRDRESSAVVDGIEIVAGTGQGNANMQDTVERVIGGARDRIVLQCPYVSDPFWRLLGNARRRNVHVTVIMPSLNNRSIMKWGTLWAARRYDFEVRLLPGVMTHQKTLLADDALIIGSANFDCVSYRMQPEIVLIVRDRGIVSDFRRRVVEPDLGRSRTVPTNDHRIWLEWLAMLGLRLGEPLAWVSRERRRDIEAKGVRGRD